MFGAADIEGLGLLTVGPVPGLWAALGEPPQAVRPTEANATAAAVSAARRPVRMVMATVLSTFSIYCQLTR
ncbi:MAG: hypothetical protein DLM54_05950 [Acidimicrobiales bacterium]|nr:MAG: hypothetical protein DLM54_05950 [Acidimicrobiales bacterium]